MTQRPLTHWSHLVGNIFQSISGTNQERINIICKWLDSFVDEMVNDICINCSLQDKVEEYCSPYFRKE